mmetsp:Transcript_44948/g.88959  ORF Transcript_44948/g.88959 Transcript_44948/m.88959 type:complete len:480 (-) Transcript_44948:31-1470(-)
MPCAEQPPAECTAPGEWRGYLTVHDDWLCTLRQKPPDESIACLHEDIHKAVVNNVQEWSIECSGYVGRSEVRRVTHIDKYCPTFFMQTPGSSQANPCYLFHTATKAIRDPHSSKLIEPLPLEFSHLFFNLRHRGLPPPLEEFFFCVVLLQPECALFLNVKLPHEPKETTLLLFVHQCLKGAIHLPEGICCLRVAIFVRVHCKRNLAVCPLQDSRVRYALWRQVKDCEVVACLEDTFDGFVIPILGIHPDFVKVPFGVARTHQHQGVTIQCCLVPRNLVSVQLNVLLSKPQESVIHRFHANIGVTQDHQFYFVFASLRIEFLHGAIVPVVFGVVPFGEAHDDNLFEQSNALLEATGWTSGHCSRWHCGRWCFCRSRTFWSGLPPIQRQLLLGHTCYTCLLLNNVLGSHPSLARAGDETPPPVRRACLAGDPHRGARAQLAHDRRLQVCPLADDACVGTADGASPTITWSHGSAEQSAKVS